MSTAMICLGSNTPDANRLITMAVAILAEITQGTLQTSSIYPSDNGYNNCVISLDSDFDHTHLHALTKMIEEQLGRTPQMKSRGIVPIDIDIVTYDGRIMREADYHQPYFSQGLNEILGNTPD